MGLLMLFSGSVVNQVVFAGGNESEEEYSDGADVDPDELAMMFICKYSRMPGPPFVDGGLNERWDPTVNDKLADYAFDAGRSYGFVDYHCEKFVLEMLISLNHSGKAIQRCYANRGRLSRQRSSYSTGSVSSFRRSTSTRGRSSAGSRICRDGGDESSQVACAYNDLNKDHMSGDQMQWASDVSEMCAGLIGNRGDNRRGGGGSAYPNPYGSGACYNPGGITVIKRQNTGLETVLNFGLGLAKVGLPIWAMYNANKLHERNASQQSYYNYKLGYPSALTAGQGGYGGMGYGGGYGGGGACIGGAGGGIGGCGAIGGSFGIGGVGGGCIYGMGGCGGHYSGMGGGGIMGGPMGGFSGACPMGACYGNGGVVVGGSGGFGGGCGMPPMSPYGVGCGGAGGGFGFPGGVGGVGGMPGYGGIGGNPFPGPLGTANGGSGWPGGGGGAWGQNGMYNAPWGATSPGNAGMMSQYANQYQQYLAAQQKQAQTAANYARIYQQKMTDLNKNQEGAYKAYMATMYASQGMGGGAGYGGPMPGYGGGSGYYGGGGGAACGAVFCGGGGYSYYPPYTSQPSSGLSVGIRYQQ